MANNLTYAKSGVNIRSADKFVKFISKLTSNKNKKNKQNNIGNFGSSNKIPRNLKQVHIVASTDGVGTKIEIANELNKFDTIGVDLVAMSVNDILVQGGKPFIFLDYISINKIVQKKLKDILNKVSFVDVGFYIFNVSWGILLVVSLFPIDESNLLSHLLIFTLKVNILSLVLEMIFSIGETISLVKQNDCNEKYHIEPEVIGPIFNFSWKEEVAMRLGYSCVCMLLTFGFVANN